MTPHIPLEQQFDPFDLSNPFPFYEQARREAPVFYSEQLKHWIVTRHDDVKQLLSDLKTFSATGAPTRPNSPAVQKVLDDGGMTFTSGMAGRMPPEHTRIRAFANKALTPRRFRAMEAPIRARVVELLETFKGGRANLVKQLTYDLPALVVFMLLGVPDEDVVEVKRWALARIGFQWGDPGEEEKVRLAHDMVKYYQYCVDLIEKRFAEPRDDLPSDLVRIYQAGDTTITKLEMASLCYTLLFAGHETTSSVLAEGIKTMLTHPASYQALCNNPALIPNAMEEMLRYCPSIFSWRRIVTQPVTLSGVELPVGAQLMAVIGSGNRDEKCFFAGESFDIERDDTKEMLTFGHGVKYCLGAPLARMEGTIVLEEITKRFPTLRLAAGQSFDYAANTSMRGPSSVIVEWDE
jgi:cytochrome P450